jgi:colanic acid/amylovoran biosynthesis glycosyltransferase
MLSVAYLANRFPEAVEPYVTAEIEELRRRGIRVVSGSIARADGGHDGSSKCDVVLRPVSGTTLLRALRLCVERWTRIADLIGRVLLRGDEGPVRRLKALMHTVWGACYAARLEGHSVEHIHVHHGFSASWIGMVAARLLDVDFSMTLHGSDLLLHRAYLDTKLKNCSFCLTVSEYNRQFIHTQYPNIETGKVLVARLGVEVPEPTVPHSSVRRDSAEPFQILAVGRLHAVKDHAFLIRACARLQAQGVKFRCQIAGEGPERRRLQSFICENGLERQVELLGQTGCERIDLLYRRADLVVLTSRSEGIPLVLMEAMARGTVVLAPAITGIPELVIAGKTGFLYQPGSIDDFLKQLFSIRSALFARTSRNQTQESSDRELSAEELNGVRRAARAYVAENFNRRKNLESFVEVFQRLTAPQVKDRPNESFILQQI